VAGVRKAIAFYENYDCEIADSNTFINLFYGIEDESFFQMNVVGDMKQAQGAIEALNEGNNIITTNIFKEKLGLKLGDIIKIRYGDRVEEFKITGFVETNLGIGHVAYISGDNYRKFIGSGNYDCFMVQGNVNSDALKLNLKRKFTKNILSIETKEELKQSNSDKVESIFKSINIYTYFAVAIGMLGMMNNIVAGYMERKQSLALYRCIGMSRKGLSKMLLVEAVTIGVIGSVTGVVAAIIMMNTIPQAVGVMWGNVTAKPAGVEITILCITSLLSMFFVSILPLKNSTKISILESTKYE
jgi:putative ABC transport system permease protein